MGKPDDILGSITLLPDQFIKEGIDAELKLENTGHAGESFLKLKIKLGEEKPLEPEQKEEPQMPAGPLEPEQKEEPQMPECLPPPVVEEKVAPRGLCCWVD